MLEYLVVPGHVLADQLLCPLEHLLTRLAVAETVERAVLLRLHEYPPALLPALRVPGHPEGLAVGREEVEFHRLEPGRVRERHRDVGDVDHGEEALRFGIRGPPLVAGE